MVRHDLSSRWIFWGEWDDGLKFLQRGKSLVSGNGGGLCFHSKTLLTHLCHDSVSTQMVTHLIEQICVSSRWKGKKFMACPRVTVVEDRFFPAVVKQISKLFHWIFFWNWSVFQLESQDSLKCRVFLPTHSGMDIVWYDILLRIDIINEYIYIYIY